MNIFKKNTIFAAAVFTIFSALMLNMPATVLGQSNVPNSKRQSARSDKLTGGTIEKTTLAAGADDIKITVNAPSFQLTLWQGGKEVKTYQVGIGMKDYPIVIGQRQASAVIWNPTWIPPNSDWVTGGSHKVKAGEVIKATDPRNPLGKLKIPLGDGYLIHQAKGVADLGNLVSHGCVRMLKTDLFDLAEKIVAARALPVTPRQIARAKTNLVTLTAELAPTMPVEITYDTQVVEAGRLHIYPDVYERGTNTEKNLRDELDSSGVDTSRLSDKTLARMLAQATGKKQYTVSVRNLKTGSLRDAQVISVLRNVPQRKTVITKRVPPRRRVLD